MGALQIHEGIWQPSGSTRQLFYRLWQPPNARALLIIVHGFAEHSGRYHSFAEALAASGFAVACYDLWGHGKSGGARGDLDSFDRYLDDAAAITRDVLLPKSGLSRPAVVGHSMGGLIALHWALRAPESMRALILQSPFFGAGFRIPAWKTSLQQLLRGWWPSLAVPLGLRPEGLSRDPEIARRYRADPLVHHRITLRAYGAIQDAILQAFTYAGRLAVPTLVLTGEGDRVMSLEACAHVVQRLRCDTRAVSFPNCLHELHHESVREHVVTEVTRWVEAHA